MRRFGFLLLAAVAASSGCVRDPDEKAIRALLEGMRTSAETKDFQRTVAALSADYRDNHHRDRDELAARMSAYLGSYDRLVVQAPIQEVERNGLSAVARTRLIVIGIRGDQREYVYGFPLVPKKVEIFLDKRSGKWGVTGSQIQR